MGRGLWVVGCELWAVRCESLNSGLWVVGVCGDNTIILKKNT